jgi:hypothetical protein
MDFSRIVIPKRAPEGFSQSRSLGSKGSRARPSSLSSRSPEASGPKRSGSGSAADGRRPQVYARGSAVDGRPPQCYGHDLSMDGGRPQRSGRGSAMNQGRPHCYGLGPAVDGGCSQRCGRGSAVDGRSPHCYRRGSAVDGRSPHCCGDLQSTARANLLVSSLKMLELEPLRALVRVSTHQFPSPRVCAGHCRTEKGAEAGDSPRKKTAPKSRLVRGDTHQGTRRSLPKAG